MVAERRPAALFVLTFHVYFLFLTAKAAGQPREQAWFLDGLFHDSNVLLAVWVALSKSSPVSRSTEPKAKLSRPFLSRHSLAGLIFMPSLPSPRTLAALANPPEDQSVLLRGGFHLADGRQPTCNPPDCIVQQDERTGQELSENRRTFALLWVY
jgi:hypothetical protein